MAVLLGVDTGGTYTDAVILDDAATRVLASAKALTTRPDLAPGIGEAMDAVIARAGVGPGDVALVSLSTTLATNALVEGQGGRVALVLIGFEEADLGRDGLAEALRGDPVIRIAGGHDHSGRAVAEPDLTALAAGLNDLPGGITGIAVAGRFATRNPVHEIAARDLIRAQTGLPVTCGHELSAALGGPKRALTALLNARLIGLIARLIDACEAHMAARGIAARLMVVRGDGALMTADMARERPIETILSGPAASVAGAAWLTGLRDALVSDIGGTTTDICLLRNGRPGIDPAGARVGPFRTMVEAVAMRTTGLGGDSEVHLTAGLDGGLRLGPRRVMPVSLLARQAGDVVHRMLDRMLAAEVPGEPAGRFALPLWSGALPIGLDMREAAIAARLAEREPVPLDGLLRSRIEGPALDRLITRGLVLLAGITPSDAAHVLGLATHWDAGAARKALTLFARRRTGRGEPLAADAARLAGMILDQVTAQTVDCLLSAAFAEDGRDFGALPPEALARHPLTLAALDKGKGLLRMSLSLDVPVIGLGASASTYYPAVGRRLGVRMIVPPHAEVANAVGAVVGLVTVMLEGSVTSPGPGAYVAHLPTGPMRFTDRAAALAALDTALRAEVLARAHAAGVPDPKIQCETDLREVAIEGQPMFIEAVQRLRAFGRPRLARDPEFAPD